MRIHAIVPCTEVEGPGRRFAIWTQGCDILCPGCFNTQAQSITGGYDMSIDEIMQRILLGADKHYLTGVTIAGGEPLLQVLELDALLTRIKRTNLNIMLYTGRKLAEISWPISDVIRKADILISEPFVKSLAPDSRRWVGSTNQIISFFNESLKEKLTPWPLEDHKSEIIIGDDDITICGNAVDLIGE